MSSQFDQPLHIELAPSPVLLAGTVIAYLVGALLWSRIALPAGYLAALYAVMLLHGLYLVLLHAINRLPTSIHRLGWDAQQGWWLQCASGRRLKAGLCLPVFVSRYLVAVRFRTGRLRFRSIIVTRDRLGNDSYRRLRVRLIQSAHDRKT